MAIDATEGGVAANSYVTEAEADTYFQGRLNSEGYVNATQPTQEQALRTATIFLDSRVRWIGDIKDQITPQALAWPRVYDINALTPEDILVLGAAIPQDLKNAQCELALYLIDNDDPVTSNALDSIKVGSLDIDFNEFVPNQLIPDSIWSMISYLGNRQSALHQVKAISLSR
jgi:hypothetical protein